MRSIILLGQQVTGVEEPKLRRTETEVSLKRYKYVGKERDEETGLYYYGARYYAAWIARFVSVDPLATERQWLNPYNYVQNNPLNRIDPNGALDDDPPKKNAKDDSSIKNQYITNKSKTANIGSVHFTNTETEEIVKKAMLNDINFANKIIKLSKSKITYTFDWLGEVDRSSNSKLKQESTLGAFHPDKITGDAIIGFETYKNAVEKGPLRELYHETQHAIQFERGDLGFVKTEKGEWTIDLSIYDILDEVEAFEAGYNSPGYSEYHRDQFMKKSLIQKAKYISKRNAKYKNLFKTHGLEHLPVYPNAANSKILFKNEKYIRFQRIIKK